MPNSAWTGPTSARTATRMRRPLSPGRAPLTRSSSCPSRCTRDRATRLATYCSKMLRGWLDSFSGPSTGQSHVNCAGRLLCVISGCGLFRYRGGLERAGNRTGGGPTDFRPPHLGGGGFPELWRGLRPLLMDWAPVAGVISGGSLGNCKKCPFFTIATAKTDESIQNNSGLPQGLGGRLSVVGAEYA